MTLEASEVTAETGKNVWQKTKETSVDALGKTKAKIHELTAPVPAEPVPPAPAQAE
jgi:hypothetical protein